MTAAAAATAAATAAAAAAAAKGAKEAKGAKGAKEARAASVVNKRSSTAPALTSTTLPHLDQLPNRLQNGRSGGDSLVPSTALNGPGAGQSHRSSRPDTPGRPLTPTRPDLGPRSVNTAKLAQQQQQQQLLSGRRHRRASASSVDYRLVDVRAMRDFKRMHIDYSRHTDLDLLITAFAARDGGGPAASAAGCNGTGGDVTGASPSTGGNVSTLALGELPASTTITAGASPATSLSLEDAARALLAVGTTGAAALAVATAIPLPKSEPASPRPSPITASPKASTHGAGGGGVSSASPDRTSVV